MRTILSLSKHLYLKRVGVFLIAIGLIAGTVSCGDGADTYNLTMAANPAAGGTATDLTGASPYASGAAVNISAVAAPCYQFVGWTAQAGTFGDAAAAQTIFTMPAQDVTVTANFELTPPDHFKFYAVNEAAPPPPVGTEVELEDQFGAFNVTVGQAVLFGNPVVKVHNDVTTPISDPNRHYTWYTLEYDYEEYAVIRSVEVSNQFQNNEELTVGGPFYLAVPTTKEGHEEPVCLNHFLIYEVEGGEFPEVGVNLKDQFILNGEDVVVSEPYYFANPVKKTIVESGKVTQIEDPDEHWVLYNIWDAQAMSINKKIQIKNQFEELTLDLTYRDTLAVPSQKIVPPTPPLDHFKCYNATGTPFQGVNVYLSDQFINYGYADVLEPMLFCNPVEKVYNGVTTSISDQNNHFTVYSIENIAQDVWDVVVDNQFGNDQTLRVSGPVALAVPTQKEGHGLPKYIDHFLLYEVLVGTPLEDVTVDLDDQFLPNDPGVTVTVTKPVYFANPALKGYVDMTGIWDPAEHLVFYEISYNDEFLSSVTVNNQFNDPQEPQDLDLVNDQLIAVPSVKVSYQVPY